MRNAFKLGPKPAFFVAALVIAGVLSYMASIHESFPGDAGAITRFQELRSAPLDTAALIASATANLVVIIVSVAAAIFIFILLRRRIDALIALLTLIMEGLNLGVKELVGRERPMYSILETTSQNPGFPSGHAFHAMIFFGFLLYLVPTFVRSPSRVLWIRVSMSFMILICGASRVYLGVHWPSDVFGGFLLGGLSLGGVIALRKMLLTRRARQP